MKSTLAITVFVASLIVLNGCETTSHAQQGEVIGAVIGGVIGAQVDDDGRTAAIILGLPSR